MSTHVVLAFIVAFNVMKLMPVTEGSSKIADYAIVFPNEAETLSERIGEANTPPSRPPRYIADVSRCAFKNHTFCTEDDHYPTDVIQKLINAHASEFEHIFGDVNTYDDVVSRYNDDAIHFCDTFNDVYYPKSARNKDGQELFIFNTNTHKQGVRVSMCGGKGKSCKPIVEVPNTYRTECIQQFVYHDLLSLSADGRGEKQSFSFPACCSCAAYRV